MSTPAHGPLRPLLAAGLLALLAGGCSGSPLGARLAGSFPGVGNTDPAGTGTPAAASSTAGTTPETPVLTTPVPADQTKAGQGKTAPPTPGPARTDPSKTTSAPADPSAGTAAAGGAGSKPAGKGPSEVRPSTPAPYRVTIQLPQADPAAPAEALTQALRAAGLSFEVESIERVPAAAPASAPAAPISTPAPAPR
ncbi:MULTISPECIES: hypothetical protein [unclassified Synechococcus]|uniref:hypothetical protein n=1 Tax=unclassified Synechococcus TaxID=2626047 RepID=UPI0018CE3B42|nr:MULTISPECIES: hypothetical protein [unclassified Synechococcus]MEA5422228.1 hypothetical protein [Synechococcus sp. CCY9202]QPN61895.1 hypothetical protein H8F24_10285 [Synechococcus sp. CBW1002]